MLSVPVAAAETEQLAVYVTVAPLGRLTVTLILPLPEALQVPPLAPTATVRPTPLPRLLISGLSQ